MVFIDQQYVFMVLMDSVWSLYFRQFESTTGTQARSMPQSLWQQKCGFSLNHSSEDDGDTASRSEPTEVTTNITLEDELSTLSIQDDTPSSQEHYSPL